MRIKEKLQHIIKNTLVVMDIDKKISEINIENLKNDDIYTTNIAISLAKDLHKKPVEIAEELKLKIQDEMIEKVEVVYPGMLNIIISKNYLLSGISTIISENINFGKSNIGKGRKLNIEFLCLRPTNDLSEEEIFNVIYGDNLARILKYNGFEVTKEYFFKTENKEFEKLTNLTKDRYIEICNRKKDNISNNNVVENNANNIYSYYKDYKIKEKKDYFKNELIKNIIEMHKKKLDDYRIDFDNYVLEKNLYDKGLIDTTLDKLNRNGNTYFNNNELWINTKEYGALKDEVLIESDGTYTYILPTISYQIDLLNKGYDGLVSIYDYKNANHSKILKPMLKILNQDPKKIQIITLPKLNISYENNEDYDAKGAKSINFIRFLNASVYYDYNQDIIDVDKTDEYLEKIEFIEKNNVVIYNTLKNYNKKITKVNKFSTINEDLAYIILNKLYEFEEVVINSGIKQSPFLICDYVYELTLLFNKYYKYQQIITEDEVYTNERLNLLLAIKIVINNALDLIGIIPREEF